MKKIGLITLILSSVLVTSAQKTDPVLLTIDGKTVSLSEFDAIFKKNNTKETVITEESVNEYLDLYIKFKLKVREAEVLGYDTSAAFKQELEGYRKQLIQPYLTDREVSEALIQEAYERMKYDVNASHILVNVDQNALAKDTLMAYNKALKIRDRILKGEDFGTVAMEVSDDPSSKTNKGNLGYFNALHMVYPFESATYNLKVGEISMPVRTRFGYHVIKLNDKRTARGTIKVAHIMIQASKELDDAALATKKQRIDEIYAKILADNTQFGEMAQQFSDDKGSASRNGELPPFGTGKMVPEFEEAAYALQNDGDISKPVKSDYGWHIIKRIELTPLDTYENLYQSIKSKVSRDSRSNKTQEAVIAKIKAENNFKEDIARRDDFYKIVTADEYLKGEWTAAKATKLTKLMFGFYANDGQKFEYNQQDFAKLLELNKPKVKPNTEINVIGEINRLYKNVLEEKALAFKEERLPITNLEYKLLYQEYRDGILLFNLTDEKVWSKAITDSAGLENFFKTNQDKYKWNRRAEVTIYKCSDEATAANVEKVLTKKTKTPITNDELLKMFNKESQLTLTINEGKFEKGENASVDATEWKKGVLHKITSPKGVELVMVKNIFESEPKKLNEVKGLVTSDYQNFLEKEWVNELKAKYKVEVDKEVLKQVK
ncbi:MAG: peptidylprolyl isomerase [Bacteroidetes bacterium]|nr:peptidylprolyl isomerase [Bacteroidota bacterium]